MQLAINKSCDFIKRFCFSFSLFPFTTRLLAKILLSPGGYNYNINQQLEEEY